MLRSKYGNSAEDDLPVRNLGDELPFALINNLPRGVRYWL